MAEEYYNPLDKLNLAKSIESELLSRDVQPLGSEENFAGAGIYAIYYCGDFGPYSPISKNNQNGKFAAPIYVGKAIPKGGRKGGLGKATSKGSELANRLRKHASSIREAQNLDLRDFHYRHLVVDDIWIPLGENIIIESFKPLWNRAIDGFGNNDPGIRRATQYRSPWDILHPGRQFAVKLADSGLSSEFLLVRVADYLAGRPMMPIAKSIAQKISAEDTD
jgi:Eco29kI restriction endonuclease